MNDSPKQRLANAGGPLLIVTVYAVFGALWILLSDGALKLLIQDAAQFAVVSMLKGWLYVAATSLLLYGLLRRFELRPLKTAAAYPSQASFRRWLPFTLLTLCVIASGAFGITYHWQQQQRDELARIKAFANRNAAVIADELEKHAKNAAYLRGNAYFAQLLQQWLILGNADAATHLRIWMSEYEQSMGFASALFLDPSGRKLWSSKATAEAISPPLLAAVQQAGAAGGVVRTGLYPDAERKIHLDFVVPIVADQQILAVVVLRTEPLDRLFTLLQAGPDAGASGESLLLRRDGADALYLSALRYRQNAAVSLRQPLVDADLLSSQLLQGTKQPGELISGADYRGEASVAVAYPVPGTDWFLIVKKDSAEFYANASKDAAGLLLICLLVLAIGGTLLTLQDQQAQLKLIEERQRTQQAVQLQAEILAHLTEGINVIGGDGRILFTNPAFAAMFGYRIDELLERDIAMLSAQTTKQTPAEVAGQIIEQLRTSGRWQGEWLSRRKDGSIFWSYADISRHEMPVWGPVWLSVQHDISDRKMAETRLNQRNEMLERFNRIAVGRELAMLTMKQQINALAGELGRPPPYIGSSDTAEPWQPEDTQQVQVAMVNLLEDAQTARDEANKTARTLRASERRLLMAQEGGHVGIWERHLLDDSIYWSPECERLYGVAPGSQHSYQDWRARLYADDLNLFDAQWERHIERGEPFETEFRIRREDNGEIRWLYCKGSAQRDENGNIVLLSGIHIDISDRKQAELRLAESEQRYRTLADNLPGAVYRSEVNPPWRMIMLSDGVKLLVGYEACAFLADDSPLTWTEIVLAEDRVGVEQAVSIAVACRQPYRLVYRIRHADGGIRWVIDHGRAGYDANGSAEFLDGVIIDVTLQKQAEEQLRKRNAELERFNRVTVGRELHIIEMKKMINALSQELGREQPYSLAFLHEERKS